MAQKELTVIVLKRQTVVMEKKMNAVCLKKIFFVIENRGGNDDKDRETEENEHAA